MGVCATLIDFDDEFSKLKIPPVILNDVPDNTVDDKEAVNNNIFTKYTSDLLSNIPQCECGNITGEYNRGIICSECGTSVKAPIGDLESFVWVRAPEGVTSLINPAAWMMLTKFFSKKNARGSFNIIRYIADPTYKSETITPAYVGVVEERGINKRGINYFIQNFDNITEILFSLPEFEKDQKIIIEFINRYRAVLFPRYLPLPNKALLVIEENASGTWVDPTLIGGIDAIRTLVSIDDPLLNHSQRVKENRAIKCIDRLSDFYMETYQSTLAKKEGVFRKNLFGWRMHFSFRAVISSITEPHQYDQIHIPWSVAINVLELHLVNKLTKLGMSPNKIKSYLYAHTNKYSEVLDRIFKELINESPFGGIHCVMVRHPSLERGSCQALKIASVKTDPNDNTIGMSILIVKAYNAMTID